MTSPLRNLVYAVTSNPDESVTLINLLRPFKVISSVYPEHSPVDETIVLGLVDEGSFNHVISSLKKVIGIVPFPDEVKIPQKREDLVDVLVRLPVSLSEWHLRNIVWQTIVSHFVFLIDAENTAYSPDLTYQIAVAHVLGNTCIGVLSPESRAVVSSHYLAMADVTVVGGKTGILRTILGNLGEE